MKLKLKLTLIAVAALSAVLLFTACVDQTVKTLGKDADLTALNIGSATVSGDGIKPPIPQNTWESDTLDLYSEAFGRMYFNRESDIREARIRPTVSKGALAEWGIATQTTRPGEFTDTRVPATFEADEFIYIKVTSEDYDEAEGIGKINYYRFYVNVQSWVTELNFISIAGRVAKAQADEQDAGGNIWYLAEEVPIAIANGEALDVVIEATTFDPNAEVEFAVMSNDVTDPADSFVPSDTPLNINDGDFLYVKVTAENTVDIKYYKFKVSVGHLATISRLAFHDGVKDTDIEIYGLGLPNGVWDRATAGDYSVAVPNLPAGGYGVIIETEDPEATYAYGVTSNSGIPALSTTGTAVFEDGYTLAIKITSQKGTDDMYYKVKVTLTPANFAKQPQSAWYFADYVEEDGVNVTALKKQVQPLTVEMDPPGDYTYTWYGADSWFGIYGRRGSALDEKDNVSCVNGGPSMYFYLVDVPEDPDYALPANPSGPDLRKKFGGEVQGTNEAWVWEVGTGPEFTPPNKWKNVAIVIGEELEGGGNNQGAGNKVPTKPAGEDDVNFLAGSTNETRYYWCVVTDPATGLKVASNRAVIITETDPSVDHFVFELTALPRRKNIVPFKELRELHQIEIPEGFFPPGFDPSKYQICIAIAQYFLPDGRPWTQNWTHGDLHFGYDDDNPNGPLTWWHNNMGANSGSIPLQAPHSSQGGLSFPPDWIGFAPSGDIDRGLPRNDPTTGQLPRGKVPDDRSIVGGTAQGYFAGFIELLEVRFQTPPEK